MAEAKTMSNGIKQVYIDSVLDEFTTDLSVTGIAGTPTKNIALALNRITTTEKALRKLRADLVKEITQAGLQGSLEV